MKRKVMRRTFSGVVCEQEVYTISDKARSVSNAPPRLRFRNEEEREAHKLGISRRKHARSVNENFSPTSLYSTFTFDNENEVHSYKDAKYIRDLFVRRLKYAYPNAVIYLYLGRGKHTRRFHMHTLSEGIPQEVLRKQWLYGEIIDIQHLRKHNFYNGIDYGQDYTGLANYLFDHWTPEQGGHRWKQTRNARKPDREEVQEVDNIYTEKRHPAAPRGYKYVECHCTAYGYSVYKYVKKVENPKPARRKRKYNTS